MESLCSLRWFCGSQVLGKLQSLWNIFSCAQQPGTIPLHLWVLCPTLQPVAQESNIQRLLFQESTAPGRYEYELPLRGSLIATENFFYVT